MKQASRSLPVLVLAVLLALPALTACGGTHENFTFENTTSNQVTVRVSDRLRLLLAPGETKGFNTPNNKGDRQVLVVDDKGVTRLDKRFTWAELEALDFHVVIR